MAAIKYAINDHNSNHNKQSDHHFGLEHVGRILVSQSSLLARHLGKKQYDIKAKNERYQRCPNVVVLSRLLLLYLRKKSLEKSTVPQFGFQLLRRCQFFLSFRPNHRF